MPDIYVQSMNTAVISDSITRPADTTAYTAGDVIAEVTNNDYFTFGASGTDGVARPMVWTGSIETVTVTSSANQATKPSLELWLFHTLIAEVADNAAFAPTDAELATCIGIVTLADTGFKVGNAGAGAAGNIIQVVAGVGMPFRAIPTSASPAVIYGQLVVRNAYTPVASEVFTVQLMITRD